MQKQRPLSSNLSSVLDLLLLLLRFRRRLSQLRDLGARQLVAKMVLNGFYWLFMI